MGISNYFEANAKTRNIIKGNEIRNLIILKQESEDISIIRNLEAIKTPTQICFTKMVYSKKT